MLRLATDAASAAIDYSKGNIEDGVVDSLPSHGHGRTPICSPSLLKQASSSRGRSMSPSPRADAATSRKHDLPVEGAMEHPFLKDAARSPSPIPVVPILGPNSEATLSELKDKTTSLLLGPATATRLPRLEDKQHQTSHSAGAGHMKFVDKIFRQRIFRDHRRSLDSNSMETTLPYVDSKKPSLPRPPRRGSRSLSTLEFRESTRSPKRKDTRSQRQSSCSAFDDGRGPHYPSRREDIFKGLAKLKAMEAENSNCIANSDA